MIDHNDEDKYKVKQVFLETSSYTLLVLQIPEDEIDDKLTYLSREKGLIAKSLYDDFLIATCVANINPFLQHLNQKGTDLVKLNEIRAEIISNILLINKKMDPSNLVLNRNHVVKLKDSNFNKNNDIILLTENEFWNKDIYKEEEKESKDKQSQLDRSKINNVTDLDYIVVQKWWERIREYINVRQFNEEDVGSVLSGRSFSNKAAFEQYIVTVCINDLEDLFNRLDKMGLPQRVDSITLVRELYELCKGSNPFLDFERCKDEVLKDNNFNNIDPFNTFQQTAEANTEKNLFNKKTKVRLFRDIKKSLLLDLRDNVKDRVIGQDKAINDLVDAIQRSSVGLRDPEQPIGSFIFTGYTGCGKTLTAKVLAEELIGDSNGAVIVDCSEYSADHEYAKLIGSPSGYIGFDQGGYLTNAVKRNPFSVVLFDEVEKASEKVHQLLLQIMDEARLTDGKGHHVSFKDTIVIMTSNLGVNEINDIQKTIGFGDVANVTNEKQSDAINEALKKKFRPEFLNRVTSIINFNKLSKNNYFNIIRLELGKLRKNLKINNTSYSKLELRFEESLYDFIYNKGIDEKFGARPLKRTIEKEISTPLAKRLLEEDIDNNSRINIYIKDDELSMDIVEKNKAVDPPFYMEVTNE